MNFVSNVLIPPAINADPTSAKNGADMVSHVELINLLLFVVLKEQK